MFLTSKRHAYRMQVKLAADAKGHLTAYATISPLTKVPIHCQLGTDVALPKHVARFIQHSNIKSL